VDGLSDRFREPQTPPKKFPSHVWAKTHKKQITSGPQPSLHPTIRLCVCENKKTLELTLEAWHRSFGIVLFPFFGLADFGHVFSLVARGIAGEPWKLKRKKV